MTTRGSLLPLSLLTALLLVTSSALASPFLVIPEPRYGLLADAEEYAEVVPPADVSVGKRFYAQHLQTLQQHYLAVLGKHPPVYYFFCTVYYTPREDGFTEAEGFDMTPTTRSGLGGRMFSTNFLRVTMMEGFGRLSPPTSGGSTYIKYSGSWGYGTRPLGNRNNTLIDRTSAAVHRGNSLFGRGTPLQILDPQVYNCFGGTAFETADTGGGLYQSQIDLYWGEDDPLGPLNLFEAVSCPVAVRWIVPVMVVR